MREGPPLNVVIAGAGCAGLEAMFRLHRLAGPGARLDSRGWPPTKITERELALRPDATLCGRES